MLLAHGLVNNLEAFIFKHIFCLVFIDEDLRWPVWVKHYMLLVAWMVNFSTTLCSAMIVNVTHGVLFSQ